MPHADDINFFHQGTLAICGSIDTNEALKECLSFLQRYMPADNINMNYLDPAIPAIRAVAQAGLSLIPVGTVINISPDEVAFIESQWSQTSLSNRAEDNPVALRVAKHMGIGSLRSMR